MALLSLFHPYCRSTRLRKQADLVLSFPEELSIPFASVAIEHAVHLFERGTLCLRKIEVDPYDGTDKESGEEDVGSPSPGLMKSKVSSVSPKA
jgi:hypothetical protein